jgi:phosphatidylglycerol:prolipoprotein diacylglycerol transferase
MLPELHFSDSLVLPTYIVYLSLLFSALVLLLPFYARKKGQDVKIAMNLGLIMMVVGFVGARLFHVFYEDWPLYAAQPERILYVWLGGFVFLGGAIPAVLAVVWYLKFIHQSFDAWADFFAPIGAIGYGLGRMSCFFSGCCFGTYCDLPWAIDGRHPTQLYAVVWELALASALVFFAKKITTKLGSGGIFWTWVFFHAVGRVIMEDFRADFRGAPIFGFSISSFLSLILVSASVSQLILRLANAKKFSA